MRLNTHTQHAYALELANVAIENVAQPRILDVGAGSGYLTACLGRMVRRRLSLRWYGRRGSGRESAQRGLRVGGSVCR